MNSIKQSEALSVSIKEIEYDAVLAFRKEHEAMIFEECVDLDMQNVLTDVEQKSVSALEERFKQNLVFINVGAFDGEKLIGVCSGRQDLKGMFNMSWSAVLPKFRGKGIYSAMLARVIAAAKERGFIGIRSRHLVTNNAVIVPKLKAGFIISGMELNDLHGSMVHLTKLFNEVHLSTFEFRNGGRTLASSNISKFKNFIRREET